MEDHLSMGRFKITNDKVRLHTFCSSSCGNLSRKSYQTVDKILNIHKKHHKGAKQPTRHQFWINLGYKTYNTNYKNYKKMKREKNTNIDDGISDRNISREDSKGYHPESSISYLLF